MTSANQEQRSSGSLMSVESGMRLLSAVRGVRVEWLGEYRNVVLDLLVQAPDLPGVCAVWLHGSRAVGSHHDRSDLDLTFIVETAADAVGLSRTRGFCDDSPWNAEIIPHLESLYPRRCIFCACGITEASSRAYAEATRMAEHGSAPLISTARRRGLVSIATSLLSPTTGPYRFPSRSSVSSRRWLPAGSVTGLTSTASTRRG